MTTQPEIEFPSSPIEGDTRATVELVGEDWRAEGDWRRFREACERATFRNDVASAMLRLVNPNEVRDCSPTSTA